MITAGAPNIAKESTKFWMLQGSPQSTVKPKTSPVETPLRIDAILKCRTVTCHANARTTVMAKYLERKRNPESMMPNVRDQRRRALGAPLADRNPPAPPPLPASGVPTRDNRCIA
jgi:hypothetical protein